MNKTLTGIIQSKNTKEVAYLENYIVYSLALPSMQFLLY